MSKRDRLIVIHGLASGGTNLLSHLLQSHPEVVSVRSEINELIGIRSQYSKIDQVVMRHSFMNLFDGGLRRRIRLQFDELKLKNLQEPYMNEKFQGVAYSQDEIVNSLTLIKGVCIGKIFDLEYAQFLERIYDRVDHVVLTRDGVSLLDSWKRRRLTTRQAAMNYMRFADGVANLMRMSARVYTIKFEDVIAEPLSSAALLYGWLELDPIVLHKFRLDVKTVVDRSGNITTQAGNLRDKLWLNHEELSTYLKNDINEIQRDRVSKEDQRLFLDHASLALEQFGYNTY
jgi:hypothetical protein